jgi:hypothetical protein
MKRGIVITTHKSTQQFLLDLLVSLQDCKYPIVITYNTNEDNQYERRGLEIGRDLFDEFIYLHDTVIIKDLQLFDKLFEHSGMLSIAPNFLMYLGKYESQRLREVSIPLVWDKQGAIAMEFWLRQVFQVPCFDDTFIDGNHTFEEKYGKTRMVLENQYIKKYKSCYDISMVAQYERDCRR